jgi:hypothetical protein
MLSGQNDDEKLDNERFQGQSKNGCRAASMVEYCRRSKMINIVQILSSRYHGVW